jgi:uncharacterized protein HemY
MTRIRNFFFLTGVWGLTACASLPRIADSRDPLSPAEHISLGDAYLLHGERTPAIQQYQSALNQDGRQVAALMALGNLAFDDHDWEKARVYFYRAHKADLKNAGASNNLAMVDLAEGKRMDRDRHMLEEALPTAGPAAPYLLDTLATIALRENRYADAKLALDHAQAAAPKNDLEFSKHLQESRDKLAQAMRPD